jgi:hypothetical protein
VLRASAVCETAGIPTSSIVCEGFTGQARATAVGLGFPNIALAPVPGHTGVQSPEELRRNVVDVTMEQVVSNLTQLPDSVGVRGEPHPREVVFAGSFHEVNQHFLDNQWSDGLPIVPPTLEEIQKFLGFCDLDPDHIVGSMLPDRRAATIWSIAVNGVMAGCRPEYMPILVALVQAMADPAYGVEHSGNTPGAETLIILNGPITQELGFNYTQGVMRDGFQPNTSIGRFWRLYLRNVTGFLLHKTDKATFGNTWRVVVPENEEALKKIGWAPTSVDMGHKAGDNTVTIARYTGGQLLVSVTGSTPEELLPYVADHVVRLLSWHFTFTVEGGTLRPLVLLSPILAETIAKAGWSKNDVKRYLFDHARVPVWQVMRQNRWFHRETDWNLQQQVSKGELPQVFAESDDPNRLVPLVRNAEEYMIVVTGDPLRTNAYVFAHNGYLGFPVTKSIVLPRRWKA